MRYTKEAQITYQHKKIAYHFQRLLHLGEKPDTILEKMLMSQAIPEVEYEDFELIGYLKYPKEWNKKELQAMFVAEDEEKSSIQLIFEMEEENEQYDEYYRKGYLLRLENIAAQKIKIKITGKEIGETKTGKPKVKVLNFAY